MSTRSRCLPNHKARGLRAGANEEVGDQEHRHQTEPDCEQLQAQVEPGAVRGRASISTATWPDSLPGAVAAAIRSTSA